jgi:hypothetical protein
VAELVRGDLDGLYRKMLESGDRVEAGRADLGLAMIAHDYRARFATQVDPEGAIILSATIVQEEMNP